MGIPTLITTNTITSGTGTSEFESNIDSTYDEYMFVCTDVHPANNAVNFQFQVNASGQSGYNETITSTAFRAQNNEASDVEVLGYTTGNDQAQGTGFQTLSIEVNNDNDGSLAGILHLFTPSNTTYVTHFYSRFSEMFYGAGAHDVFTAGYFNLTEAITNVQFKFAAGNIDNAVIQMYGIA
jgi:hypothetical protein